MSLIVQHLQRCESEPIVWLCEELCLHHELKLYKRGPKSEGLGAPPELKAMYTPSSPPSPFLYPPNKTRILGRYPMSSHPITPVIQDSGIAISETGAIIKYVHPGQTWEWQLLDPTQRA